MIQANERANLLVLSVLGGALILVLVGAFACVLLRYDLPPFTDHAATALVSGLLGYLGAHRQAPSTGNQTDVAQADSVVVQAAPETNRP